MYVFQLCVIIAADAQLLCSKAFDLHLSSGVIFVCKVCKHACASVT